MDPISLFARNFASITYDDLPSKVVAATKNEILDLLAVAVGGSSRAGVEELRQLVTDWGGKQEATVFGWGHRLPAFHAAQLNATMAHALDFDDTHDTAVMHPGVVIIPVCLVLAERQGGVSGQEFITAVALGVDMMCRLGLATVPHSGNRIDTGWHLTVLYGFLAAAGVAGRLLGLDEDGIVDALGIAYHQASGNGQCVLDGALTKRMGPGFAARGGIVAALMAEKGITGARNCLEGKYGLFNQYHQGGYDPEALTAGLGKDYEGVNVSIKPYPCCRGTHTAIDAALSLVSTHTIKAGDVKEISVYTGQGSYSVLSTPLEIKSRPRNAVDSQFSIPWSVAVAVARGRVTMADFIEEAIESREILDVSEKIRVELDSGLSRRSGVEPARVTITTMRGGQYTEEVEHPLGSPERPMTWNDLEKKLSGCSSYGARRLAERNVKKLAELLGHLEELGDVGEVIELTTWH
ncbi:MAG: MmgE/PrpD family protein [Anaerolineae bacterium]